MLHPRINDRPENSPRRSGGEFKKSMRAPATLLVWKL
jgi:hypothetical protein